MQQDCPSKPPALRDDLGEWLWPWPAQATQEFFEALGASFAAAPGPQPGQATLKYFLFSPNPTDEAEVRQRLQLAARLLGQPALTSQNTARVTVRQVQYADRSYSCTEVPIAVTTPEAVKREYGIDLAAAEALLPLDQREPGRIYQLPDSPQTDR